MVLKSVAVIAVLVPLAACGGSSPGAAGATTQAVAPRAAAGQPASVASPAPSGSPPVTVAPGAGNLLLQEQIDGSAKVITSGTGFSVVHDVVTAAGEDGDVTTFDAAGGKLVTIGDVDADCGASDIFLPSGRRVILALTHEDQPAQGVNQATTTVKLNEFDASTGHRLWSTDLIDQSTDTNDTNVTCNLPTSDGTLIAFSPTADGGYAVDSETSPGDPDWIINLTTGAAKPTATATRALGSVIVNQLTNNDSGNTSIYFTDPATGARTGTLADSFDADDLSDGASYATKTSLIYVLALGGSQYEIRSLTLPAAQKVWTLTQFPFEVSDITVTGSTVIASNHYESQTGVIGYDLATGRHLWTQPNSDLCGASNGKIVIAVNDQLATLNAATGKQVSFDASQSSCPTLLPNGISWDLSGSDTLTVRQYL
jgi:hypothetical protein